LYVIALRDAVVQKKLINTKRQCFIPINLSRIRKRKYTGQNGRSFSPHDLKDISILLKLVITRPNFPSVYKINAIHEAKLNLFWTLYNSRKNTWTLLKSFTSIRGLPIKSTQKVILHSNNIFGRPCWTLLCMCESIISVNCSLIFTVGSERHENARTIFHNENTGVFLWKLHPNIMF
jgi:hypothetical protein